MDLEMKFEQYAEIVEHLYITMGNILYQFVDMILNFGVHMTKTLYMNKNEYDEIIDIPLYRMVRYCTFPWHFIWILGFIIGSKTAFKPLIYDKDGIHIIIGGPGCGKSSLLYYLMERIRILFGKPSYINSMMEKPRLSEDRSYRFIYHVLYKFTDFWNSRRMIKVPNHKICGSLGIDEGHRELNYRENGTSEYNDKFIPFIKYAVLVRKYIKKIYITTQMGKVDTQLMALAESITQPRIDIGFDYPDWLIESGIFKFKILGFYIDVYGKDINGDKTTKPISSFYIKNEYADFDYFDTYAESDAYDHLPMDDPKNIIRERIQ